MFLSGSFAVTLQCSHQCDHSVPGLKILKEPKRWTKDVLNQYIYSVLGVFLQCSAFGKIWGHCKHMPGKLQNLEHLKCACSVPRFYQKRNTAGTLPGHCKCTDLEHLWYIALVLFKFSKPGTL